MPWDLEQKRYERIVRMTLLARYRYYGELIVNFSDGIFSFIFSGDLF